MRALAKTAEGPGALELIERECPEAPADWVVLRVLGSGICGTDLHIASGGFPCRTPVTLGHEFVGEIVECGAGVTDRTIGDRVVCEPHIGACGDCPLCRRGVEQLCPHKVSPGIRTDGGLADYVAVPARLLHRVPDGIGDALAAVCEPTAISVTAMERISVQPGETVAVLGPGPVGLIVAMIARAVGAGRVVVVGRSSSANRLALADKLGIEAFNADRFDVARSAELTGGLGFDVVMEASGGVDAVAMGLGILRRRGRMCVLGLTGTPTIEVPWDVAVSKGVDVRFSMSSSYTSWDRALTLLDSGQVDADPLITTYPLDRWWSAFEALGSRDAVKAVLVP